MKHPYRTIHSFPKEIKPKLSHQEPRQRNHRHLIAFFVLFAFYALGAFMFFAFLYFWSKYPSFFSSIG